jgi:hypothetical protein
LNEHDEHGLRFADEPEEDRSPLERGFSPNELIQILSWVRAHNYAWEFPGEQGIHLRALFARATSTFTAATHLTASGYGAQAIMLCRPLFEDMVLICWIKWIAHPNLVTSRLRDQERHSDLIWNEVSDKYPSVPRRPIQYEPNSTERARYKALFGEYGQIPWWETRDIDPRTPVTDKGSFKATGKPRKLRVIISELAERAVPHSLDVTVPLSGPPELLVRRLEHMHDVVNRTNNEMLHHTARGNGLSYDPRTRQWRDGATNEAVPMALSSLLITYDKLIFVMIDHGNHKDLAADYLTLRTRLDI